MMLARAFVSHYRRHPIQLLALALMIVLATMLWTGVTVLTDQARTANTALRGIRSFTTCE
jgi:putative ABC transport system permease protein